MHQIRRFDDLGRIVIPKEIREAVTHANNTEGVQMEVYMDDGAIVLKPHKPKDMVEVVRCKDCQCGYVTRENSFERIGCTVLRRKMRLDDYCVFGVKMDGGDKE